MPDLHPTPRATSEIYIRYPSPHGCNQARTGTWAVTNVEDLQLLSAGVDAIGSLGRGRSDSLRRVRGTKTATSAPLPNAKRYLRERGCQPADRRKSPFSGTARGNSAWESGTTRSTEPNPPRPCWTRCRHSRSLARSLAAAALPIRPEVLASPSLVAKRPSRMHSRGHVVCAQRSRLRYFRQRRPDRGRSIPFHPGSAALEAGRLVLRQIDPHARLGRNYVRRIRDWQANGYRGKPIFSALASPAGAIASVTVGVSQGGHAIPESVIRRRFDAGLRNFRNVCRREVDWRAAVQR